MQILNVVYLVKLVIKVEGKVLINNAASYIKAAGKVLLLHTDLTKPWKP